MIVLPDSVLNLYHDAIRKGYVVFAPKGAKDLRMQYPELETFKEFKDRNKLTPGDMLFVWYFRCSCSPVAEEEDLEKLEQCIHWAYPSEVMRQERMEKWGKLRFSGHMQAALERMATINASVRIRRFQLAKRQLDNCTEVIMEKMPTDTKGRQAYLENVALANKIMASLTADLENNGAYGVEESSNTVLASLKGILKDHRTQHK